ncbi:MAG: 1,4-dihydroxy-6-naphthoate synthase [Rhodospirillaceae bacterium]|nr:1,4-dihydroxy-6-naphthoate synthase [Rhodospirillaceae bacterium]
MGSDNKYEEILYEVKDGVAWITINRPDVMNAFREQTLDELIDAFQSTRHDPTIAVAVVTGAGDQAFSAGGDFHAMMRLNWQNAAQWNDRMLGCAMAIRGLHIPVIAMINGWCMGGGHELALWCDLAIACDDAQLGQTGARVGACPTVGATQYIPRLIGERLAREMIFGCRTFKGPEAEAVGLINRSVPREKLRETVEEYCERIKGYSSQTIRQTKRSLNFESDQLYASWQHGMELLAHVWGSEESLEGMNAFMEKRKPDFDKFRQRNKVEMDKYLDGLANDENMRPPKK